MFEEQTRDNDLFMEYTALRLYLMLEISWRKFIVSNLELVT